MKLTIITINLNNKEGLRKTLNSISIQTDLFFELIVIDGGSVDGSQEIAKSYLNIIEHYISEKDLGIYDAMNKGIKLAKGEYCFFLNSGDLFANNNVIKEFLSKNYTEDFIYGDLILTRNSKKIKIINGIEKLTFMDLFRGGLKHQATFIKTRTFFEYGLYDSSLKIVGDWAFFLKTIGFMNCSTKYISQHIACFDTEGISNSGVETQKIIYYERKKILKKLIPDLIIQDYIFWMNNQRAYIILQYSFGMFMIKVLYKIIKMFKMLTGDKI